MLTALCKTTLFRSKRFFFSSLLGSTQKVSDWRICVDLKWLRACTLQDMMKIRPTRRD